jgi:hypothetical protein
MFNQHRLMNTQPLSGKEATCMTMRTTMVGDLSVTSFVDGQMIEGILKDVYVVPNLTKKLITHKSVLERI